MAEYVPDLPNYEARTRNDVLEMLDRLLFSVIKLNLTYRSLKSICLSHLINLRSTL